MLQLTNYVNFNQCYKLCKHPAHELIIQKTSQKLTNSKLPLLKNETSLCLFV